MASDFVMRTCTVVLCAVMTTDAIAQRGSSTPTNDQPPARTTPPGGGAPKKPTPPRAKDTDGSENAPRREPGDGAAAAPAPPKAGAKSENETGATAKSENTKPARQVPASLQPETTAIESLGMTLHLPKGSVFARDMQSATP
ncbi:MAG: hypothetical protein RLZZ246_1131, partial [Planctomycetota bacterium]